MLISPAFAETATTATTTAANKPSSFYVIMMQLLPFILIFAVFYLILILPQKRKQKAHRLMLSNLKVGDQVVLNSGIIGKVTQVKDNDRVFIKTGENTEIEIIKSFIARVIVE